MDDGSYVWFTQWAPDVSAQIDPSSITELPVCSGGFSSIYSGNFHGGKVAIKILKPSGTDLDQKAKLRKVRVDQLSLFYPDIQHKRLRHSRENYKCGPLCGTGTFFL